MLLELLEHHSDLLKAAILPLIWRRDCRSLAALSATCRWLRNYVLNVPQIVHILKLGPSLRKIKNINILYNKYVNIREYDNKMVIYSCWEYNRSSYDSCNNTIEYYVYILPIRQWIMILHNDKIKITPGGSMGSDIYMKIEGSVPNWISKYDEHLIINTRDVWDDFTFVN
jgi:hypothetical protein